MTEAEWLASANMVPLRALRGETTALMLERLGPDTELHVTPSGAGHA